MRRCRVAALPRAGTEAALAPGPSHHLSRVCRLSPGSAVLLFDGAGQEQRATITRLEGGVAFVTAEEAPRNQPPRPAVHLVLGLPKGPALDDAVRMAVEAGVTELHPVWAARTQGRPDRMDRWERIVESAATQCGRADLPPIHPAGSLRDALARLDGVELWIALPGVGLADAPLGSAPAGVLVGPEGGWTDGEIESALAQGARGVELGPYVLRTPTAVAVAVAWLARATP